MGYYNDISLNDTRTTDDDWYDRKDYGRIVTPAAPAPAPAPVSDLPIPRTSDILDRACDVLDIAYRHQDDQAAGQLERLIRNLPGASLCWQLGTLHVVSPSGGRYQVTRGGCSCPNGKAGRRQCWHWALLNLLLDMFTTDVETHDMAADLADRITQARNVVWATL